jgi:elongation factor G
MHRDVTRLRNIGIMASVDAGNATCRACIVELAGGLHAPNREGERCSSETLPGEFPATIGTWASRSGPFAGEPTRIAVVEGTSHVFDGALVVLDGARGAAATAEAPLRELCARRVPCVAFIDDVGGIEDLEAMTDSLESDLGLNAVPLHVPWNDDEGVHVIDVLEQRLIVEGRDGHRKRRPLPKKAREHVARIRRRIVDVCAEHDESMLGLSATGLDVGADELARALRKVAIARDARVLVVACGSLRARRGVGLLLDALVSYLPSSQERPPAFGVDPRRGVRVARLPREDAALAMGAFAMTDHPSLGRLTWLRLYSGTLRAGTPVAVLPRDARGVVEQLFVPDVSGLVETEVVGPGAIVCATGLAEASPGDTLACIRSPVVLDERPLPLCPPSRAAASDREVQIARAPM